ncbi:MAG: chemotaxis protein CheW [Cyanobacteria bacterium P01_G01_bin.54]
MSPAPSVAEQLSLPATTYFTFRLAQTTYAVESRAVVEVFFLPEFTPVPALPSYMVGVVNVRGKILPLLDVQLRLGQMPNPYQVSDRVILLAAKGQRFGIIVQDIYGVESLTPAQFQPQFQAHWPSSTDGEGESPQQTEEATRAPNDVQTTQPPVQNTLQTHLATSEQGIVVVLDPELILQPPTPPHSVALEGALETILAHGQTLTPEAIAALRQALDEAAPSPSSPGSLDADTTYADTHPAAQQILRDRAIQLAQVPEQVSLDQRQTALAILKLNQEWLGLDVAMIREFTEIGQVTPIPYSPAHILGNTNLRGEIITLVDISTFLALPPLAPSDRWPVVIVEIGSLSFGIAVSAVVDIHLYDPSDIQPLPLAVQGAAREVIEGAIAYQGELVSRLSLSQLLGQAGFRVHQDSG